MILCGNFYFFVGYLAMMINIKQIYGGKNNVRFIRFFILILALSEPLTANTLTSARATSVLTHLINT